jgi:hypothetical protein
VINCFQAFLLSNLQLTCAVTTRAKSQLGDVRRGVGFNVDTPRGRWTCDRVVGLLTQKLETARFPTISTLEPKECETRCQAFAF